MGEVRIFGIRHHGPGSAIRLREALQDWQPDLLLIELPGDAQDLISRFNPEEMTPPVAMLLYDPGDFVKAAYFPLAIFSPEWQALQYAFQVRIPVRAIDLPIGVSFKNTFDTGNRVRHPFRLLAEHTAFEDTEQWWDHFMEQQPSTEALFDSILELMQVLREKSEISEENKIREQYMSRKIKAAAGENFEKITVVCGAFHGPALQDFEKTSVGKMPKLRDVSTESVWIPWSYERLTQNHAYSAGVHRPLWYEHIFLHREDSPAPWVAHLLRGLRGKHSDTSSASGIEVLRLAESLTQLRQKTRTGLPELEDATTSVLFEGRTDWLEKHFHTIYIGEQTGTIEQVLYTIPLQKDFRVRIRSARLSAVLEDTGEKQKTLDLRKIKHREHSRFFYQCRFLNIPLATVQDPSLSSRGNFKEVWTVAWDPASEWSLIRAGTHGTTIAGAAYSKMKKSIGEAASLEALVPFLDQAFLCGFSDLFEFLQNRIINIYSLSESILALLQALQAFIFVDQYGDIRYDSPPEVHGLIDRMGARAAYLLPIILPGLTENEDTELRSQLKLLKYTLAQPRFGYLREYFSRAWWHILTQGRQTDYYRGMALKLCIDQGLISEENADQHFTRHLSGGDPEKILDWLEGLLLGAILWIAYDQSFRIRLNQWLSDMQEEVFQAALPVLRSIFSQSGIAERKQLFTRLTSPDSAEAPGKDLTGSEPENEELEALMAHFFPQKKEA